MIGVSAGLILYGAPLKGSLPLKLLLRDVGWLVSPETGYEGWRGTLGHPQELRKRKEEHW